MNTAAAIKTMEIRMLMICCFILGNSRSFLNIKDLSYAFGSFIYYIFFGRGNQQVNRKEDVKKLLRLEKELLICTQGAYQKFRFFC